MFHFSSKFKRMIYDCIFKIYCIMCLNAICCFSRFLCCFMLFRIFTASAINCFNAYTENSFQLFSSSLLQSIINSNPPRISSDYNFYFHLTRLVDLLFVRLLHVPGSFFYSYNTKRNLIFNDYPNNFSLQFSIYVFDRIITLRYKITI